MEERDTRSLSTVKERLGVPAPLRTCHTAEVGGYIVEGHVPADVVKRLLDERPTDIVGIGVAGMPVGSPGMEVPGRAAESYQIQAWNSAGQLSVYETR